MTPLSPLEKALALTAVATVLLVTSVALWPLLHQPAVPTVIQTKSWQQEEMDKWAEIQKQYQHPKK